MSGEMLNGLRVLWRDELHIAIDKPTGLRSTPGLDTSATAANDGDADVELDTDAVPGATGGAQDGASAGGSVHDDDASARGATTNSSNNKRKRQDRWSEVTRASSAGVAAGGGGDGQTAALPPEVARGLAKLSAEAANVPRKRSKFARYCERSLKADAATADALWAILQVQIQADRSRQIGPGR